MRLMIAALLLVACAGCQNASRQAPAESVEYDPGYSDHQYHQTK